MRSKPLHEQVIVLTGATSGIGLTTARMAADRGAKLVLTARNPEALEKLREELTDEGAEVITVAADVANEEEMVRVAVEAVNQFGNFDTWINNAGVSIYGKLEDVSKADSRRLFDTNFWGVVNGSLVAARYLKQFGGTIINIGSTLSERAIPIQGMYSASKHAVKGFTDALRMELEAEGAPINVTLIKPAAIDTPYKEHAKNYLKVEPQNPPPVYAPEIVAEAILHCCENPVRDVFAGGGGMALAMLGNLAPGAMDTIMEKTMIDMQKTDRSATSDGLEGLHTSRDTRLAERGNYPGHVAESSIYTTASLYPKTTIALSVAGLFALAAAARQLSKSDAAQHRLIVR